MSPDWVAGGIAETRQAEAVAIAIRLDKVDSKDTVIIRVIIPIKRELHGNTTAARAAVIHQGLELSDHPGARDATGVLRKCAQAAAADVRSAHDPLAVLVDAVRVDVVEDGVAHLAEGGGAEPAADAARGVAAAVDAQICVQDVRLWGCCGGCGEGGEEESGEGDGLHVET